MPRDDGCRSKRERRAVLPGSAAENLLGSGSPETFSSDITCYEIAGYIPSKPYKFQSHTVFAGKKMLPSNALIR
jgi:hypothetical protein